MSEYYSYNNYDEYINFQTIRARKSVKDTRRHIGRREFIYNKMLNFGVYGESILCVGARDSSEVIFFEEKKFKACGIDLFEHDKIIKCDMSRIYDHPVLKNKIFDIIFSNESMEHCLDLEGFIKGLNLVCKKYFVCMCPIIPVSCWDCSQHSFMQKAIDIISCKEELNRCFSEFEVVINEFYRKNKRLFFILKRKIYDKN